MRKILIIVGILLLSGCTYTATNETGTMIDVDKVSLIERGKTTDSEIKLMFGEPITKVVINDTDTKWIYQYIVSSASSQMYTGKSSQSLKMDVLDILFRNGVVVNFTHSQSNTTPKTQLTSGI